MLRIITAPSQRAVRVSITVEHGAPRLRACLTLQVHYGHPQPGQLDDGNRSENQANTDEPLKLAWAHLGHTALPRVQTASVGPRTSWQWSTGSARRSSAPVHVFKWFQVFKSDRRRRTMGELVRYNSSGTKHQAHKTQARNASVPQQHWHLKHKSRRMLMTPWRT